MRKIFLFAFIVVTSIISCTQYSAGPINSPDLKDLIATNSDCSESDIRFYEKGNWFVNYLNNPDYHGGLYNKANPGIAPEGLLVATDKEVLFLVWSKEKEQYGRLFQFPFSEISAVNLYDNDLTVGILTRNDKLYLIQLTGKLRASKDNNMQFKDTVDKLMQTIK